MRPTIILIKNPMSTLNMALLFARKLNVAHVAPILGFIGGRQNIPHKDTNDPYLGHRCFVLLLLHRISSITNTVLILQHSYATAMVVS